MIRDGFLTPLEASKYLGISLEQIYEMLEAGELPGIRLGGRWRVRLSALERWLDEEVSQEELSKLAKRLKDVDTRESEELWGREGQPQR